MPGQKYNKIKKIPQPNTYFYEVLEQIKLYCWDEYILYKFISLNKLETINQKQ